MLVLIAYELLFELFCSLPDIRIKLGQLIQVANPIDHRSEVGILFLLFGVRSLRLPIFRALQMHVAPAAAVVFRRTNQIDERRVVME